VRSLLIHIEKSEYNRERIKFIFNKLTKKEQRIINNVCKENYIDIIQK